MSQVKRHDSGLVTCDVAGLAANVGTVDALARLRVAAHRQGLAMRLSGVSAELRELIDLLGLERTLLRQAYVDAMDFRLELVPVPVSDVDRAKDFYVHRVGFAADVDVQVNPALRFVQLTPPGSACSVVIGTGITEMEPGSQRGLQLVVADIDEARQHLLRGGVETSEVAVHDWGSFVYFADPDGNTWAVQQLPDRG